MPPKRTKMQTAQARALRERDEFKSGFHISANGNPTRKWEGLTLTVFRRDSEYCWVCSDEDDEPTYSTEKYETQDDAIAGLADHLDIGRL